MISVFHLIINDHILYFILSIIILGYNIFYIPIFTPFCLNTDYNFIIIYIYFYF